MFLLNLQGNCQQNPAFEITQLNDTCYITYLDSGYFKRTRITGKAFDENHYFKIWFSPFDEIQTVQANYTNHRGRTIKIKKKEVLTSFSELKGFNNWTELIKVPIPKTTSFTIEYSTKNSNPFGLSLLEMNTFYPATEITKTLVIAPGLKFFYDCPADDSLYTITKKTFNDTLCYTFRYKQDQSPAAEPDLPIFYTYPNLNRGIRTIIAGTNETPEERLNQQFLSFISQKMQMDSLHRSLFDSLAAKSESDWEIAENYYNYVQKHVVFIHEMNLFEKIPKSITGTFNYKRGNSIEIAMLLTGLLRNKGLKANLALCPSNQHDFDFDFASVSSFNHAICIWSYNKRHLILDATKKYNQFGTPSIFINGEKMLIISENSPVIADIPITDPSKNLIRITIDIDCGSILQGTFEFHLHGQAIGLFQRVAELNKGHQKDGAEKVFLNFFEGKYDISNVLSEKTDSTLIIKGNVSVNNSFIPRINNSYYLNPSFLPKPFFFKTDIKKDHISLCLPFAYECRMDCNVHFDCPVKTDSTTSTLSEDGFNGFFSVSQVQQNTISLSSGFSCKKNEYHGQDLHKIQRAGEAFKGFYNQVIVL